jgi:hypothetical protein
MLTDLVQDENDDVYKIDLTNSEGEVWSSIPVVKIENDSEFILDKGTIGDLTSSLNFEILTKFDVVIRMISDDEWKVKFTTI